MPENHRPRTPLPPLWAQAALAVLCIIVVWLYWKILDNTLVFDSATMLTDSFFNEIRTQYSILTNPLALFKNRWLSFKTFLWIHDHTQNRLAWQHGANIAVHAANILLVFVFYRGLFGVFIRNNGSQALSRDLLALAAATFYALHPLSVYATAYLAQRTIQLATFFALACLIAFLRALTCEKKSRATVGYALSVVFYFLAVYSKENVVPLPGVLLLLAFLVLRERGAGLKDVPAGLVAAFACYALVAVQITLTMKGILLEVYEPHGKAMVEIARQNDIALSSGNTLPLSVMTQGFLYFRYLFLWIVPYLPWISIDVHTPFPTSLLSWPETAGFAGFVILFGSLTYALFKRRDLALTVFGLLSPMLLFATEFSTVRLSEQFVIYRSYFWMIGLFAAVPDLLRLVAGLLPRIRVASLWVGPFALYAVLLGFLAENRLLTFESRLAVWEDTMQKIGVDKTMTLKLYRTYNNYAHALTLEGQLEKAIYYYQKSIQINPYYTKAHSNLGAVLTNMGRHDEAKKAFQKALALEPTFYDAVVGMGVANAEQGDYETALEYYAQAIKTNPKKEDAYYNSGNALLALQQFAKAEQAYGQALQLNPTLAEGYFNLGILYQRAGNAQKSQEFFDRAERLRPGLMQSRQAAKGGQRTTIIRTN